MLVVSFFAMFVRSAEMRSSRIIDQTFLLTQTIGTMSQLTSHKMQTILLFLILMALSPRLARAFGKFIVMLVLFFIGILVLAAWPHVGHP